MKKFLKRSGVALVILIGFIVLYGYACDILFKDRDIFLGSSKRYWQLSIKNQNYDYLVLGSSRAYASIDINLLDSLTHSRGVNFGLDGSGYKENYLSLKLLLLNNNSLRRVYFQVDPYSFMSDKSFSNAFHTYTYLPFWNLDRSIQSALIDEAKFSGHYPFLYYFNYFVFNKYYSPYQVGKSLLTNDSFCNNDSYNCDNGNKNFLEEKTELINREKYRTKTLKFSPNKEDSYYYHKIITLLKRNNIKVVTFTAPSLQKFDDKTEKYLIANATKKYYRMTEHKWNVQKEYFRDSRHVNRKGRTLFTRAFANFLKQEL